VRSEGNEAGLHYLRLSQVNHLAAKNCPFQATRNSFCSPKQPPAVSKFQQRRYPKIYIPHEAENNLSYLQYKQGL
jgi:hypothetical protein